MFEAKQSLYLMSRVYQTTLVPRNVGFLTITLQPFNGLFSRTTWVSRYLKGKTNLDFTGARDSEWQWHQLGHMQVCTSLQTDNHASTPPLCFFTGRMHFLPPNQQRQSTEGTVLYTSVLDILVRLFPPLCHLLLHVFFVFALFSVSICLCQLICIIYVMYLVNKLSLTCCARANVLLSPPP